MCQSRCRLKSLEGNGSRATDALQEELSAAHLLVLTFLTAWQIANQHPGPPSLHAASCGPAPLVETLGSSKRTTNASPDRKMAVVAEQWARGASRVRRRALGKQ